MKHEAGDLEVGEAQHLSLTENIGRQILNLVILRKFMLVVDNVLQLTQEPGIDLGQFVDAVDGITFFQCLCDSEDTQICRMRQFMVEVVEVSTVVAHKAVHALTDHTQPLLNDFLE